MLPLSYQALRSRCSTRLAEEMEEHKVKVSEFKCVAISSEVKCYCSTNFFPAPAEDRTGWSSIPSLMSEDGGELDDDESIFAAEINSDGGIRGGLKFICR